MPALVARTALETFPRERRSTAFPRFLRKGEITLGNFKLIIFHQLPRQQAVTPVLECDNIRTAVAYEDHSFPSVSDKGITWNGNPTQQLKVLQSVDDKA